MAKRLRQQFGSRVVCRYVDTKSTAIARYDVKRLLASGRTTSVVTIDNEILPVDAFSPQQIVREVERRLARGAERSRL